MEAGDLALVEGVLGELLGEADEDGFALLVRPSRSSPTASMRRAKGAR